MIHVPLKSTLSIYSLLHLYSHCLSIQISLNTMAGSKHFHFWSGCHTPSMEHGKNVGFKLILPIHFLHHLQSHCLSIQISLNTIAASKHFHLWSGCHTPSMEH